jgi:2-dehydro-3-deoxy-D-pentonate aldolase
MKSRTAALEGVFVPNIVPYQADGSIHEDELRRIIRWLCDKGVTGFYPNGSMGEFIRLSYEERQRVVRIVTEEANGRPILAGAAEPNVDLVLEMCAYCADLGCRAVSITGPYYYKLSQESIEAYFRELAAKSPIDIVIYNIPAFANEISVPVLKRLALDCPRIIGTKDTSRDMPRFQSILHEIKSQRPDFACLMGWDELLCPSLFMGGDGGTLSSAGVVPEALMKIYNDARAGNWKESRRVQFKLLDLFGIMISAPSILDGFRAGYEARGFHPGGARFPLSPEELRRMDTVRERVACVLAECGYPDSPQYAVAADVPARSEIEQIVRRVLCGLY